MTNVKSLLTDVLAGTADAGQITGKAVEWIGHPSGRLQTALETVLPVADLRASQLGRVPNDEETRQYKNYKPMSEELSGMTKTLDLSQHSPLAIQIATWMVGTIMEKGTAPVRALAQETIDQGRRDITQFGPKGQAPAILHHY